MCSIDDGWYDRDPFDNGRKMVVEACKRELEMDGDITELKRQQKKDKETFENMTNQINQARQLGPYARLANVSEVLQKRFPNLTVAETIKLASQILEAL